MRYYSLTMLFYQYFAVADYVYAFCRGVCLAALKVVCVLLVFVGCYFFDVGVVVSVCECDFCVFLNVAEFVVVGCVADECVAVDYRREKYVFVSAFHVA